MVSSGDQIYENDKRNMEMTNANDEQNVEMTNANDEEVKRNIGTRHPPCYGATCTRVGTVYYGTNPSFTGSCGKKLVCCNDKCTTCHDCTKWTDHCDTKCMSYNSLGIRGGNYNSLNFYNDNGKWLDVNPQSCFTKCCLEDTSLPNFQGCACKWDLNEKAVLYPGFADPGPVKPINPNN